MMPLGMAEIGDVNIIRKITGRDDVRQHLAELGFVVGAEVRVVNDIGGNLILSVKDSRVALDRTMAMRIMV
ncbi:MAG: ferrous iron transport protein A [Candidatus Fimadaptatus sp.]